MEIKFRISEDNWKYLSATGTSFKDLLSLRYDLKVQTMKRLKYPKKMLWYYLVTARINQADYDDMKATVKACGYTNVDTDSFSEVIADLILCFSEAMPN